MSCRLSSWASRPGHAVASVSGTGSSRDYVKVHGHREAYELFQVCFQSRAARFERIHALHKLAQAVQVEASGVSTGH